MWGGCLGFGFVFWGGQGFSEMAHLKVDKVLPRVSDLSFLIGVILKSELEELALFPAVRFNWLNVLNPWA